MNEFELIALTNSYSVIRDPFDRFPSSVSQLVKKKFQGGLKAISARDLEREVKELLDYLGGQKGKLLSATYVHFQPQVDYIYYGGDKIVKNVYVLEDIGRLVSDIRDKYNFNIADVGVVNRSYVFRNDGFRWLFKQFYPIVRYASKNMSTGRKDYLRDIVFKPRGDAHENIFKSNYVFDFITKYYKCDIDLYNSQKSDRIKPSVDMP